MAPECIQMSNTVTSSCDIWYSKKSIILLTIFFRSLGCTIIELINGFPPYYDTSGITALFRMVQGEIMFTKFLLILKKKKRSTSSISR